MTSDLAEAPAAMKLGAAGAQVIRVARRRAAGLEFSAVLRALAERGHHPAAGRGRRRG